MNSDDVGKVEQAKRDYDAEMRELLRIYEQHKAFVPQVGVMFVDRCGAVTETRWVTSEWKEPVKNANA